MEICTRKGATFVTSEKGTGCFGVRVRKRRFPLIAFLLFGFVLIEHFVLKINKIYMLKSYLISTINPAVDLRPFLSYFHGTYILGK